MAISIQSELCSEVLDWYPHANLTAAKVAELIVLSEAMINRDARNIAQETKVTNVSISAEYVNVPTGFLQVKSFETTTGGRRYALKVLPDEIGTDYYPDTGIPLYYSIVGSQFRFTPVPSATQTSVLVYYAVLTALGTSGSNTNWLLTNHPDIYLYATLFHAAAYLKDPESAQGYLSVFNGLMDSLNRSNARNRWGGPGLVQRPG